MRAVAHYENSKLETEDVAEPRPGEGEVKVEVSRNGICGTDLHEYYDGHIFIPTGPHPLTGKGMPLVGLWFALRGLGLTEIDVIEPSATRRAG